MILYLTFVVSLKTQYSTVNQHVKSHMHDEDAGSNATVIGDLERGCFLYPINSHTSVNSALFFLFCRKIVLYIFLFYRVLCSTMIIQHAENFFNKKDFLRGHQIFQQNQAFQSIWITQNICLRIETSEISQYYDGKRVCLSR